MFVTIDPGHGSSEFEGIQMWKLSRYLEAELIKHGFSAASTRPAMSDNPSVEERGKMAANNNSVLMLSLHSNAVEEGSDTAVTGTEAFYSIKGAQYKDLAGNLAEAVSNIMGHASRGVKTLKSAKDPASDYYGVIRSAANNGCTCAMILEHGFQTNKNDALFLEKDENLQKIAEAEASIIAAYFIEIPILSATAATSAQAKTWAEAAHATDQFIRLADIYWEYSQVAGVNPAAAYCQSAKETGYGRFGGVIDDSYCNPCGMKTRGGGGDYDKNAHHRFKNWTEGVRAHIDHLALYAGADGYPKAESDTPDPRHFPSIFGRTKTVEGLGTCWAPSPAYGKDIVAMINAVKKTKPNDKYNDPEREKKESFALTLQNAVNDGVIDTKQYWEDVLEGKHSANPDYIKILIDRYHAKLLSKETGYDNGTD